jgi:NADPH2 dehydrogenase
MAGWPLMTKRRAETLRPKRTFPALFQHLPMSSSSLFKSIRVGKMELQHRVVHAPMTRLRADQDHVVLPMVADYYEQRSRTPGTLLIAEGTIVHPKAGGLDNAPGIWSDKQIDAWRMVRSKGYIPSC